MSPLALLYIFFASSPVFNNWNTESNYPSTWNTEESTFPSTWNTMPMEHEYEPSSFFGYNEEPRMFNYEKTESVRPIVHLISRIAKVNPILIEKILSCPETSRFVKKVLHNVEPETLLFAAKLISKVPVNIREKVARHVLKNILTTKSSSVFGSRSIMSEMYPTEESMFSTSNKFHAEEPIEKLFSTRRHFETSPVEELLSTIFSGRNTEEEMTTPFNMYPTESSTFGSYEPETSFFNNEYEMPSFGRWNKLSKHF